MAFRKVLLVEGIDDEHVVKNLCGSRDGPWIDEVKAHNGVNELLEAIPTRVRAGAGLHIIGVVVDADNNVDRRWQAIIDRLRESGYRNLPASPSRGGSIIEPDGNPLLSRFGVWVMPDNENTGILEHFLRRLVPPDSRLFAHVQSSVDSIPEVKFTDLARPKVLIHTYLAWQADPGCPYGTAIKSNFLNPRTPEVDDFMAWLRRLYLSEEN